MLSIKPLACDFSSLKPVMGPDTLFFHHEKHYAGYVTKANELMPKKWRGKCLKEIISLARENGEIALFNQVAQVFNHEFFFDGLSLDLDNQEISDDLMFYICKDYHNVENLKSELIKTAMTRFGSGWVWLVLDGDHLKIQSSLNAENPVGLKGLKCLWVLDVWEHAYYLDYQNRRQDYATEVVNNAINWRFVSENLAV